MALDIQYPLTMILTGCILPMSITAGVIGGSLWLWYDDFPTPHLLRVAGWTTVGAIFLAGGVALTIWYQYAEGGSIVEDSFMFLNALSGGGLCGFVLGTYDSQQRIAKANESAARSRLARRSNQLTVLNRVLRHDLRNHLTVILGRIELFSTQSTNPDIDTETLVQKIHDIEELSDQARAVEQLIQAEDPDRTTLDLVTCVESALEALSKRHPEVNTQSSLPDSQHISAHPKTKIAVENVLVGIIERSSTVPPVIKLSQTRKTIDEREYIELQITTNDLAFPDEEVRALERGFETRLEHGTGLKLWMVNWIMDASRGDFRIRSRRTEGDIVCLQFMTPAPDW